MAAKENLYIWQEFCLSTGSRRFYFKDLEIPLTRMEFQLLQLLITSPEQVFSRGQILAAMELDSRYGAHSTVDSHVSRIRKKVRSAGGPTVIKAVHGIGFRLEQ